MSGIDWEWWVEEKESGVLCRADMDRYHYIYAAGIDDGEDGFSMIAGPSPNFEEVMNQSISGHLNSHLDGDIVLFRARVGEMKPYLISKDGGGSWRKKKKKKKTFRTSVMYKG